jgi:tetratricopeptide (TPR) repeat protein
VKTAGNDPQAAQAWLLLARLEEAAGDRKGAIEAFSQAAARGGQQVPWTSDQRVAHARLLKQDRRWDQAREVLGQLLKAGEPAVVVEAAHSIAETYESEGNGLAAAEYYLSAAYLAPDSPLGRRGLLGAARSLAAAKQTDAAAIA